MPNKILDYVTNNTNKIFLICAGLLIEVFFLILYLIKPLKYRVEIKGWLIYDPLFFYILAGILLLIFLVYILAFRLIKDKSYAKIIIYFFILFNLSLMLLIPLGSGDLYTYIYQGRIMERHHANPFITAYSELPQDELYPLIKNRHVPNTTLYGPVFLLISAGLAFLGGNSFVLTMLVFKLFFVLINFINCLILYKLFKNIKAVYLYAWNPLILFEVANNAHNDVLITFFLFLSFFFVLKKAKPLLNFLWALIFLVCSILIKYITIIFLPFFILFFTLKQGGAKKRILFFTGASLLSALIIFLFYAPFWHGVDTLAMTFKHASRLNEPSINTSFVVLMALTLLSAFNFGSFSLSFILGRLIFIIYYIGLMICLYSGAMKNLLNTKNIIKYFVFILLAFYLTSVSWLVPWYLTILISLAIMVYAIDSNKRYLYLNYIITLYGIIHYIFLR